MRGMPAVCTTAMDAPKQIWCGTVTALLEGRLAEGIGKWKDGICYDMILYFGHRNFSATELWRSQTEKSIFLPDCIGTASETKYLCFVWTLTFSHTLCRSYSPHLNWSSSSIFSKFCHHIQKQQEWARSDKQSQNLEGGDGERVFVLLHLASKLKH